MALAEMLLGPGVRLPRHPDDLHGPAAGVVKLPRHLSWPGMRECDLADGRRRRSLYGLLLAQGTRNDVARFVNAGLLRQDWPLIKSSLDARLSRWCERRFGLAVKPRAADPRAADPRAADPASADPGPAGARG